MSLEINWPSSKVFVTAYIKTKAVYFMLCLLDSKLQFVIGILYFYSLTEPYN